jgi:hypothetical protein
MAVMPPFGPAMPGVSGMSQPYMAGHRPAVAPMMMGWDNSYAAAMGCASAPVVAAAALNGAEANGGGGDGGKLTPICTVSPCSAVMSPTGGQCYSVAPQMMKPGYAPPQEVVYTSAPLSGAVEPVYAGGYHKIDHAQMYARGGGQAAYVMEQYASQTQAIPGHAHQLRMAPDQMPIPTPQQPQMQYV